MKDISNAPLSLNCITAVLIIAGIFFSLQLTSNKRRGALWIEMALIPAIVLAYFWDTRLTQSES